MFIDRMRRLGLALSVVSIFCALGQQRLRAVTVEVEDDSDDASSPVVAAPSPRAMPTLVPAAKAVPTAAPVPKAAPTTAPIPKAVPTVASPAKAEPMAASDSGLERKSPGVRISEKIGFYYFLKAGFMVPNESKASAVGRVVGSPDNHQEYQTGDKTYVELTAKNIELKPGDLLVVFRDKHKAEEPHSGFSEYWVLNLAVVKVLEVEKKRCLVQAEQSFGPYEAGDQVRLYDDEIKRWKQAQIKKSLPDHPIKCFVAKAEPNEIFSIQSDFVVLTAGSKKGVVEGQRFQLRDTVYAGGKANHITRGAVQVFYAGADYSMAQILNSEVPIQNGFEALYQP